MSLSSRQVPRLARRPGSPRLPRGVPRLRPDALAAAPARTAEVGPARTRLVREGGPPLLSLRDVSVRFGGVLANDSVSLDIAQGQLSALIGPNGAGKTTLFNVVSGTVTPTQGRVLLGGRDITGCSRRALARQGIARTFQNLELVEGATVLDNVLLGTAQYVRMGFVAGLLPSPPAFAAERSLREIAGRALLMVDMQDWARERAGNLPYGLRRHVEIARAIAAGPRLLLLDEPSAGMDSAETATLGALVGSLVDRLGITVLLVEHDMAMVRPFADHVHVLNQGRLLRSGTPADVLADPEVRRIYLGTASHA